MRVPLSLPYSENAAQCVLVHCAVIPELVTGVDLLLTLDDYDSLCFAADESKYYSRRPFIRTRREPPKSPNNRESEKKDSPEKKHFYWPSGRKKLVSASLYTCTLTRDHVGLYFSQCLATRDGRQ